MQKWEHQTIIAILYNPADEFRNNSQVLYINDEYVEQHQISLPMYLHQAGQEGWEIAGMSGPSQGTIIIFKRPIG